MVGIGWNMEYTTITTTTTIQMILSKKTGYGVGEMNATYIGVVNIRILQELLMFTLEVIAIEWMNLSPASFLHWKERRGRWTMTIQSLVIALKMDRNDAATEVQNHGIALSGDGMKVQCKHCSDIFQEYKHLQHHLGGIEGGYVTSCKLAPKDVKDFFRDSLIRFDIRKYLKEVEVSRTPDRPLKRKKVASSGRVNEKRATDQEDNDGLVAEAKNMEDEQTTEATSSNPVHETKVGNQDDDTSVPDVKIMEDRQITGTSSSNRVVDDRKTTGGPSCRREFPYSSSRLVEFSMSSRLGYKRFELNEVKAYLQGTRESWSRTGCSIVLDGWIGQKGRNLVNIIVDCPSGPTYLRSIKLPNGILGVIALQRQLEHVILDIGVKNVVQVVSYSTSTWMRIVGNSLMEKYESLFWSVSATHCIVLMLEEIALLDTVARVFAEAERVRKFIVNLASVFKFVKSHIDCSDLVKDCKIMAVTPFLALEGMWKQKDQLESMFVSVRWRRRRGNVDDEGNYVTTLVQDLSFWSEVETVVRATIPLVHALCLINDKPCMGFIYETMDQVKETIRKELNKTNRDYMPFWSIIDRIWDTYLHSPLHAAGHFLNPLYQFSSNLRLDSEVLHGRDESIARMINDQYTRDRIFEQIGFYCDVENAFRTWAETKHTDFDPADVWSKLGKCCPDLQKFAIKILSQTTCGGELYGLERELAETMLSSRRKSRERKRLKYLTFMRYNLHLKRCRSESAKKARKAKKIKSSSGGIDRSCLYE